MKRKVLSLLVVAAMAVTMLAGCGGSDKSADKGDGSKKELNILMEQVPDTDYVLELLDKYEEETGVKVNVEAVNYEIMHEKLMTQLTAKESNYDVLVVDNYWVGEFVEAGWMEDLSPYIKESGFDTSKYVKSMWEMVGEVDGTPYMIPFYNYMFSLIYRTDIFADKDLQAKYKEETGKELKMPCDTLD